MEIPALTEDLTLPDGNELPAFSLNDLNNNKMSHFAHFNE